MSWFAQHAKFFVFQIVSALCISVNKRIVFVIAFNTKKKENVISKRPAR